MKFSDHQFLDQVRVALTDGKLFINQMKVYAGEEERPDELEEYKAKVLDMFNNLLR